MASHTRFLIDPELIDDNFTAEHRTPVRRGSLSYDSDSVNPVPQFVVREQTTAPRVFSSDRGADGRARRSEMPLLFWLPMIFLSAMIELSAPPRT
jgi:hypothetical protein